MVVLADTNTLTTPYGVDPTAPVIESAAVPQLSDEMKYKIDESGFDVDYLTEIDGEVDLSKHQDDKPFQVTNTTLSSNKLFIESARELLGLFSPPQDQPPTAGEDYDSDLYPKLENEMSDASDFEVAQWGIELMGTFNWDATKMAMMTYKMGSADPRQRMAFYNMMNSYDKLPDFTWDGSSRMIRNLASDLTTYLGLGTLGTGMFAKFAAKNAGKTGLKAYLKSTMPAAIVAGIEGGAYGSFDDIARQLVKVRADKQDDINLSQNAIATTLGAGAGFGLGAVLPAAATAIAAGAKKFTKKLLEPVNTSVLRSGVGPVDENVTKRVDVEKRETRVIKQARITADDQQAIDEISKKGSFKNTEVLAEHRRIKEQYPESEGWARIDLNTETSSKKNKKGGFDLEYKKQPYGFNRPKKGKAPAIPDAKMVARSSDGMVNEVVQLFERAKKGDTAAAQIIEQQKWYANMRERLRFEFGSMADVFADVIGATSAQTNVRQNWDNSIEVMRLFSRGDYDETLNRLSAWLDSGKNLGSGKAGGTGYVDEHMRVRKEAKAGGATDDAAFDAAQLEFPLITKSNGKLINANSPATMLALLDLFRKKQPGGSPKTYNFRDNLLYPGHQATIDVWAARFLRRMGGGKRIPPVAEQGVGGEFGKADVNQVTGEFGFGQAVFSEAANKLREKGIDLGDVAGIPDRDALTEARQGIDTDPTFKRREDTKAMIDNPDEVLLSEKRIARTEELQGFIDAETPARRRDWVKQNFGIEDNDAAKAVVADLRKEVTVLKRENKKRDALQPRLDRLTEAKETATAEGEKFIADNAAPVRRFTAGLSLDRPEKTAADKMMSKSQGRLASTVEGDESVLAAKQTSGIGRYIDPEGEVFDERAIDFEYVARQDHDPADVVRQVVQEAKDTNQESAFFSEVVKPGTVEGANPGLEIYFKRKLVAKDVNKLTKMINKLEIDTGFTFTTDLRQANRQAAGAESETYVGVRMQYVPEFGGGEQGRKAAEEAIINGRKKLLEDKDLDYIANADYIEYDTEVFFRDKGDYDAELTGNLRSNRRASWRRQPWRKRC